MAFEDFPSDAHFQAPWLAPTQPSAPSREPSWLLALGIVLFVFLMYLTWSHGSERTPPVCFDTTMTARLNTYQAEYLLYQQVKGGPIGAALGGSPQKQATDAGNAWRDISAAVMHADVLARSKRQDPFYGDEYAALTTVNAAALYGAAGNLPAARSYLEKAVSRDPARANAYRQFLGLYQPAATPVHFSADATALLQRLSTGPLLRARNAQLTGNKAAVLAALLPGERAGQRGIVVTGIIGVFFVALLLAFIILGAVYWPRISLAIHGVMTSAPEETPWGIGAALIAISAVFIATALVSALLVRLLHVRHDNYELLMPISGAAEILCALGVLGIFLIMLGKHPLAWSEFGWHAAGKQIGYGLATLFFVYPLVMGLSWLSDDLVKNTSDNPVLTTLGSTTKPWLVLTIFAMAVVMAPLVEETLFRGLLFRALGARLPFWSAACISGVLFAIGHGELVVILPISLLGIAFAFLNRKTGNLWTSAAAHGVFNALASCATLLFAWAMHGPGS